MENVEKRGAKEKSKPTEKPIDVDAVFANSLPGHLQFNLKSRYRHPLSFLLISPSSNRCLWYTSGLPDASSASNSTMCVVTCQWAHPFHVPCKRLQTRNVRDMISCLSPSPSISPQSPSQIPSFHYLEQPASLYLFHLLQIL